MKATPFVLTVILAIGVLFAGCGSGSKGETINDGYWRVEHPTGFDDVGVYCDIKHHNLIYVNGAIAVVPGGCE